jgi:hypothetical protein
MGSTKWKDPNSNSCKAMDIIVAIISIGGVSLIFCYTVMIICYRHRRRLRTERIREAQREADAERGDLWTQILERNRGREQALNGRDGSNEQAREVYDEGGRWAEEQDGSPPPYESAMPAEVKEVQLGEPEVPREPGESDWEPVPARSDERLQRILSESAAGH